MGLKVVRNLGSNKTHLAEVTQTTAAVCFGAVYRRPPADTEALCGVHISDGVVMQEGTRMKCSACKHIKERWYR